MKSLNRLPSDTPPLEPALLLKGVSIEDLESLVDGEVPRQPEFSAPEPSRGLLVRHRGHLGALLWGEVSKSLLVELPSDAPRAAIRTFAELIRSLSSDEVEYLRGASEKKPAFKKKRALSTRRAPSSQASQRKRVAAMSTVTESVYHVIPSRNGWSIRISTNKATKKGSFATKKEAVIAARRIAVKGSDTAKVVIHRRDGSVQIERKYEKRKKKKPSRSGRTE